MGPHSANRRDFLRVAATTVALSGIVNLPEAQASGVSKAGSPGQYAVELPPLHASTEARDKTQGPFDPPSERMGFAIVGLGHFALGQILPAFGKTRYCRPVALVSGDKMKALRIAEQYGIKESSIYDYKSGLVAVCSSGYGAHRSQWMRLEGDEGWAELDPAFGYTGLKLRTSTAQDGHDVVSEPSIEAADQFAVEMDHMAFCVRNNVQPHTPGEEGLQDLRIIEAIYESARTGKSVSLAELREATRGPEPISS